MVEGVRYFVSFFRRKLYILPGGGSFSGVGFDPVSMEDIRLVMYWRGLLAFSAADSTKPQRNPMDFVDFIVLSTIERILREFTSLSFLTSHLQRRLKSLPFRLYLQEIFMAIL